MNREELRKLFFEWDEAANAEKPYLTPEKMRKLIKEYQEFEAQEYRKQLQFERWLGRKLMDEYRGREGGQS